MIFVFMADDHSGSQRNLVQTECYIRAFTFACCRG
jgi:hypothetical protein